METPSEGSGSLVESKAGFDPRIVVFYGIVALMLLVLAGGLVYQQLIKGALHHEQERQQNERRVIVPGPRGNIYDREGRLLVGNRPRFAVVLYLDELRPEFRKEYIRIRNNYRNASLQDMPTSGQIERIAHVSVVQRYMDQINEFLGRTGKVDGGGLQRHLERQLLLPYTLIDDLKPEEFARLIEHLPVNSPVQVYTSNTRYYPYGAAAAHALGYVGVNEGADDEEFPGEGLTTLKMKGTIGRDGIEKQFDSILQGEAGYTILRVDPAGYKVNPPIEHRLPVQGKSITTSLDIDLQQAAEEAIGEDRIGAAVVMDVHTGEVLAMASEPAYDLNVFSPRLSVAAAADIEARKAWANTAISGVYSPGSTFKIVVSTAALRSGSITPEETPVDCEGAMMVGNRRFTCDNGEGHHGLVALPAAIAESCDIYFYTVGLRTSADVMADQARRFHLDRPTGIDLPGETHRMLIPDPAWKKKARDEAWTPGDTANMSIGQGDVQVTPMVMACFAASFARDEVSTHPTLIHDAKHRTQESERTGLTAYQRAAILKGMEGCTTEGTAAILTTVEAMRVPGVRIAGKTGTAQITRNGEKYNEAWFICFAPLENPEIAMAVAIEGTTAGEAYGGGRESAPVASAILKKYFAKKRGAGAAQTTPAGPG